MAPVPIEDRIKDAVPFLNNVMLIGDKRKYVTCLVTIKVINNLPNPNQGVAAILGAL